MAQKFLITLAIIGACAAFPADDPKPPATLSQPLSADSSVPSQDAPAPVPASYVPVIPTPEQNEAAESDLKTDNTYWWRRSYYPSYRSYGWYGSYYPRHYNSHYPRSYSSYSYYNPHSYWSSW